LEPDDGSGATLGKQQQEIQAAMNVQDQYKNAQNELLYRRQQEGKNCNNTTKQHNLQAEPILDNSNNHQQHSP